MGNYRLSYSFHNVSFGSKLLAANTKRTIAKNHALIDFCKKTPLQIPPQTYSTTMPCAISNEITITIAPCADVLKPAELVSTKPVQ